MIKSFLFLEKRGFLIADSDILLVRPSSLETAISYMLATDALDEESESYAAAAAAAATTKLDSPFYVFTDQWDE